MFSLRPFQRPRSRRAAGSWRQLRHECGGNIAIITALASTLLIGAGGFAVDVGVWEVMQTRLQEAVDQSSRAATAALVSGGNPTIAAETMAASYGLVNGQNGVSIGVHWPPTDGTYQGNGMAVEVVITERAPQFFSKLFLD